MRRRAGEGLRDAQHQARAEKLRVVARDRGERRGARPAGGALALAVDALAVAVAVARAVLHRGKVDDAHRLRLVLHWLHPHLWRETRVAVSSVRYGRHLAALFKLPPAKRRAVSSWAAET